MTEVIIKRVLDTVRSNRNVDIISVTKDHGARFIEAVIATDGKPVSVDPGCAVTIEAKRIDGASKAFEGSVNDDGTVRAPITQWMLEIPNASIDATVVITTAAPSRFSTTPFSINVQDTPHKGDEISPDDPNYDVLVQVLAGEAERVAAENARNENEDTRQVNEEEREEYEHFRREAEETRRLNEAERAAAENTRISNENERVAKDGERDAKIAEAVEKSNTAENTANEALSEASGAKNSAVAAANAAAGSATEASNSANAADASAKNAATSEGSAQKYSQDAMTYANTASEHKNDAATLAQEADAARARAVDAANSAVGALESFRQEQANLIAQTPGDSETKVMSQKAVTEVSKTIASNLDAFASDGVLIHYFDDSDWAQGVFGWSGYTHTLNGVVCRPLKVKKGTKTSVSGNGMKVNCFRAEKTGNNDDFSSYTVREALTSGYTDEATFEISADGYLIINVNAADGSKITPLDAEGIVVSKETIIGDLKNQVENLQKGELIHIGKGLMTTDSSGNFTVSNASVWDMYAFPVQAGKTYDLTLLTSDSSSSRVKWAFSSLPCEDITKDNLAASVISHAEPITSETITAKLTCVTVTAPIGSSSLVLNSYSERASANCGNRHIIKYYNNDEEIVVPSAATKIRKSDIIKNNDNEFVIGAGYHVLGTLVRTRDNAENIILRMTYKVERDSTATAFPEIFALYNNHFTSTHFCLDNTEYIEGSWRFPAFGVLNEAMNILVYVPQGATLRIKDIKSEYSSVAYSHETGVRLSAHLGVYDLAPENTMCSFIAAHNLGYPSCIANPKITKDGVFVCIHDDDISRTALNADGTSTGTVLVSQSNYVDLLNYDFGLKYNAAYKGAKIPKLDEFLFYCGKVGMKPVFSTHNNFTPEQWQEIKNMMVRYGIINGFTCKASALLILESAYSVFGDKIDGYVYDISIVDNIDGIISSLDNSTLAPVKDKVIIEIASNVITQEAVTKIIAAGYKAGVFDVFGMKGARYKELIKWGVTEFVDDRNCSYGLNW